MLKALAKHLLSKAGYELLRKGDFIPPDAEARDRAIIEQVRAFTLTSVERLLASIESARYVSRLRIPGAIVECGVWRGGSTMAMALALVQAGDVQRDLYLYDTFQGMSPPTEADRDLGGNAAADQLALDTERLGVWCVANIDDVRANIVSTGYPKERVHLIRGKVEKTIPVQIPNTISLLRLDTDWYESTKHELEHLFPRLENRGVLMIDDYGHWKGARKAVDEFFAQSANEHFLHRIDYTGRLIIKCG